MILYPHGSHLSSSSSFSSDLLLVSTDILDLSSSRKSLMINTDKQSRSRSDSEYSTEPIPDSSIISQSTLIRKRNNLSESEIPKESTNILPSSISSTSAPTTPVPPLSIQPPSSSSTAITNNKSTLARTAILLAAKRAAGNNTNNYDGSTFTLIDGAEDEADSSGGLFKQRFDILDFTDDVNKNLFLSNL